MARNEPHVPSRCQCGGAARIEHDFCMLEVKARMRCTTCDKRTTWAPTIWQAYADWEDMADESAVRERLRKAQR